MQEHLQLEPVGLALPPTQDELLCDDGEPMETARHRQQMFLLLETLQLWLDQCRDGYAGGNMFLYFVLVRWRGTYEGVETTWLRWATSAGELLSTKDEKLQVAERHADLAEQRAQTAEQQAKTAEQRAVAAEAEIARLRTLLAEKQ